METALFFVALIVFVGMAVWWFLLPGSATTGIIDQDPIAEPIPMAGAQQKV